MNNEKKNYEKLPENEVEIFERKQRVIKNESFKSRASEV